MYKTTTEELPTAELVSERVMNTTVFEEITQKTALEVEMTSALQNTTIVTEVPAGGMTQTAAGLLNFTGVSTTRVMEEIVTETLAVANITELVTTVVKEETQITEGKPQTSTEAPSTTNATAEGKVVESTVTDISNITAPPATTEAPKEATIG